MRALVTGASGFIGGHLVGELRRRGHEVTVLLRPTSETGRPPHQGIAVAYGDLTDPQSLHRAARDQDVVFHLASVVGGPGSGDWQRHREVAVRGTGNMIDAAAAAGAGRFVHVSSCAVYRPCSSDRPIDEDAPFDDHPEPWNHYVRQKILAERLVWQARREGRIEATVIRPPTVLGAGDPNLVPLIQAVISSPLARIARDGGNHFPVVVIEDLVAGIAEAGVRDVAAGRAYNLSGREPITKDALLRLFQDAGVTPLPRRARARLAIDAATVATRALEAPARLARRAQMPATTRLIVRTLERHARRRHQRNWLIDCSRAASDLDWSGTGDYREAVERAVAWSRSGARARAESSSVATASPG